MIRIFIIKTIIFSFFTSSVFSQTDSLKEAIEQIISTKKADVGVSIYGLENKDILTINNDKHFPMQSVFKFHIALTVLNQVDKGNLSLTQKINIQKSDLLPNTWSPIREKYPNGNIKISLAEIIRYTVSESDNNGCDILLRLIGGAKIVNDYIHKIGIKDISIQATEEEMHKEWNVQFSNWTTPIASTELLKIFYEGKILSKKSYDFLWKVMSETKTGKNRIKEQLPSETLVAHKTGSSDTNEQGITAATNDIGIVTLPNGKHFAISVFVSNSKENNEVNEKIISSISKLTWDYFVSKTK
jgi:beta-lactamase class A